MKARPRRPVLVRVNPSPSRRKLKTLFDRNILSRPRKIAPSVSLERAHIETHIHTRARARIAAVNFGSVYATSTETVDGLVAIGDFGYIYGRDGGWTSGGEKCRSRRRCWTATGSVYGRGS